LIRKLAIGVILGFAAVAPVAAGPASVIIPIPDSERGRDLFIHKGCFVCHSINDVGGAAGPALDAGAQQEAIDPLDFAARMWRGALAMAELQSMEFGYQIDLTGQDIADLAAFTADPEIQKNFTEDLIPEIIRGWILEEPLETTPLDGE
jgi:mono/diheme cytochrome c family protein